MSPEEALQVIQGAIANANKIPTQLLAKLGPNFKAIGGGPGDSTADNINAAMAAAAVSSANNNSGSSSNEALFACTRCNSRHVFEDLSTDLMLCKVKF